MSVAGTGEEGGGCEWVSEGGRALRLARKLRRRGSPAHDASFTLRRCGLHRRCGGASTRRLAPPEVLEDRQHAPVVLGCLPEPELVEDARQVPLDGRDGHG